MLTQDQNDRIGEETEEFYAEMEMEMLRASARQLKSLEPEDDGEIPWLAIIGTAAALTVAHRGIVNAYAAKVGQYVGRDTYGAFMLNGATEATPETAGWILQDARDRATAAAPAIVNEIQGRSQYIINTANTAYLSAASRAAAQVRNGTNAKVAVERAVSSLARQGVTYSDYMRTVNGFPQRVRVPVDVGIRRAIRTHVCQSLGEQTIGICNQTGVNLVEVDFSTNPRESHADWEGQIYQLVGAGEYQNFYIACRWGDMVDGYGGYNCQHNIAPYTGYRHFTDPLDGTGYTKEEARELVGRQRYLENEIRKDKRERDALKEAGLPTGKANSRLSAHRREYKELVSSHSILRDQSWRTNVYAQASAEEKRVLASSAQKAPRKAAISRGGVVEGRDILFTWERRPDLYQFEIEDILAAQGFDGKPRVVSASEFEAAVREANGGKGFIAQRTYTAPSQEILDEYRDMLYSGKWYVDCSTGGAQYGQGMYVAADYTGVLSQGIRDEMEHYIALGQQRNPLTTFDMLDGSSQSKMIADGIESLGLSGERAKAAEAIIRSEMQLERLSWDEMVKAHETLGDADYMSVVEKLRTYRSEPVHYVETMTLDPSARIVTYSELDQMRGYTRIEARLLDSMDIDDGRKSLLREWIESEEGVETAHPSVRDLAQRLDDRAGKLMGMDYGSFAAAMGYDAINAAGHGASGSYTVILNRTKLIIKEP